MNIFKYDFGSGIYGEVIQHPSQVDQMDTREFSGEEIIDQIFEIMTRGYDFVAEEDITAEQWEHAERQIYMMEVNY